MTWLRLSEQVEHIEPSLSRSAAAGIIRRPGCNGGWAGRRQNAGRLRGVERGTSETPAIYQTMTIRIAAGTQPKTTLHTVGTVEHRVGTCDHVPGHLWPTMRPILR